MQKLPKKLQKNPLIDVVFELRFKTNVPAQHILPGIFISKLENASFLKTENNENSAENEIGSQFSNMIKIDWGDFILAVGEKRVGITCKMPYPGWALFKDAISQILTILKEIDFELLLERFSLKYVDLINDEICEKRSETINAKIRIGNHEVAEEKFQIRLESPEQGYIKTVQIISHAIATSLVSPEKKSLRGIIIEVDTIRIEKPAKKIAFEEIIDRVDEIHNINKEAFFNCISASALEKLEPIYD